MSKHFFCVNSSVGSSAPVVLISFRRIVESAFLILLEQKYHLAEFDNQKTKNHCKKLYKVAQFLYFCGIQLQKYIFLKKILLLSDTHSYIDDRILEYAKNADEIWHAGDFGNLEVIDELKKVGKLRGVFGNIDDAKIRAEFPEIAIFECEKVKFFMIHIGGYPHKYAPSKEKLKEEKPQIFISGHSHILKVMYDKELEILHLNPGAAGKHGWHKMRDNASL
jgi:putative phosphoesterase